MLFALVYLLLRRLVRLVAGYSNEQMNTEVEVLVLRHQVAVLKRQGAARVSAVAAVCSWPRSAGHCLALGGLCSWSARRPCFGGTGSWYDGSGRTVGRRREADHRSPRRFGG